MKSFIIHNKHISTVCALDVKELLNKKSVCNAGVCIIDDVSFKDIATLTYKAQSAHRVGVLLTDFDLPKDNNEEKLEELARKHIKNISKKEIEVLFEKTQSFSMTTQNESSSIFIDSVGVSGLLGGLFNKELQSRNIDVKVNLKHPDIILFTYIDDNHCYIGVDLTGVDLLRRPYKIITKSSSINGPFAYTLARLAGVKKDSIVVDPFCGSGTIPIETAIYQENYSPFMFENKFSGLRLSCCKKEFEAVQKELKEGVKNREKKKLVTGFDHILRIVTSAKQNAKIANVNESIHFSKVDVEWIDSKFDEGEVDVIITNPPKESKKLNNTKDIRKVYDELFYQGRFILKDEGILGILTNKTQLLEELALRHGFTPKDKIEMQSGAQPYFFVSFIPPPRNHNDEENENEE